MKNQTEKSAAREPAAPIAPDLTVNELVFRYPETKEVLARRGLDMCCGGVHPLEFAARAHGLDVEALLRELNAAVSASRGLEGPSSERERADRALNPISTFFEKDHREIDALLESVDYRSPQKSYEPFHEFHMRLERHIHWEESVLFPAVARKAPQLEAGPIRVMLAEHERIRAHKSEALRALKQGDGARAADAARAMLSALADHNAKEERVLYPACDSHFSAPEADELLAKVRALGPRKSKGSERL